MIENVPKWYIGCMKLASYLDQTGQTPTAFGRKVGVSHSAILRYLSGERTPRPQIMRKIEMESGGAVRPNDWLSPDDSQAVAA